MSLTLREVNELFLNTEQGRRNAKVAQQLNGKKFDID